MVSQHLEAKYINEAALRQLLQSLFGTGRFRINTIDDDYVLEIPRRLTEAEQQSVQKT